jgi:hypothetical protein
MLFVNLEQASALVRLRTLAVCALMMILALSCPVSAQETAGSATGSISGTVTDVSNAVVPGATATVVGAGVTKTATSNDQGQYSVSGLAPGPYTVTVSKAGFKDFKVEGLAVTAGQAAHMDAIMVPNAEVTKVTVKGEKVAEVETQTSQVSGTITQKQVVSLMLNGRNFSQLITLAPGVSNQTGQDEALVGVKGSSKFSVNGGRVEYNTFDVDGSDILNAGINGSSSTLIVFPSIDAINEVKVLTSNYGAIYGKSASGTVLVTTKSGGTKFHGDAYEFVRNEIWNARNFFDQTHGAPLYRRNDFGFTIGGPLFIPHVFNTNKDKTFFFFSEEVRRERTPQDFNQGVPSLAERTGDFGDVCPFAEPGVTPGTGGVVLFQRTAFPDCPSTGANTSFSGYLDTYPGNQVTIDPNAQILLNAGIVPEPNSTVGCTSSINSCYVDVISLPTHWHEELIRIDQTINSKLKATFRNIHDSWDTINATPQWGYVQNSFPNINQNFVGPGESAVFRLTDVASPTFFNDWVLSYTTDHITLNNLNGVGGTWQRPAGLTMGYLFNNGFGGKIPGIVIGGTNAAYGGFGFSTDPSFEPWQHSNPTFTFRDDAAAVRGNHTISFGVHVVAAQRNEINTSGGADTGDVQGLLTFSNLVGSSLIGNAFADFLTGLGVRGYQQDSTQQKYYARYQSAEPYIQDDWRYTPRMTLNLGMRFNIFGSWYEKNHNVYNWEPRAYNPAAAAAVDPPSGYLVNPNTGSPVPLDPSNPDPSITVGLVQCGKNNTPASCGTTHYAFNVLNPAPRLGLAWDPTGEGKYSIRAGYGVFFFHGTGNEANTGSLEGSAPLVLSMTQNFVPVGYECIGGVGGAQKCGNLVNGVAYPLNVTSIPTRTIWPYVQQWSLSLQRQLRGSMVGSVAYVGSKGTHLVADLQLNQLPPVPAADNPFKLGDPIDIPVCQNYTGNSFPSVGLSAGQPGFLNLEAACYGVPGAAKAFPDPNSLRTFAPGFGQIFGLENVANSHYNAFQATLRRTMGRLNLSVAYTYGSSRDDSSDRFDATLVNSFNLRSNYAASNFDQRQLLNVSYIYDLPPLAQGFGSFLRRFYQSESQLDQPYTASGVMHRLFDNWQFSGITTAQTGTPFSVINGGSAVNGISVLDNAGVANGIGAGSYPDLIDFTNRKPPHAGNNSKSFGPILQNPGAFAAPQGLSFGDAGRNVLRNPSRLNFDMALLKNFKLRESTTLELRGEAFNVFNHTQFNIYDPNRGNTSSNVITCYGGPHNAAGFVGNGVNCLEGSGFLHPIDAHRPRTIQFGAKLTF